jgi:hypothetical protein
MKTISVGQFDLNDCLAQLPPEGVVITQDDKPLALVVGVEGLDMEQIEYGQSKEFWEMIAQRRCQSTMTRAELERRLGQ